MAIDLDNPVINLCVKGTQAEFKGKKEAACKLYRQAWNAAMNDYEACIAAHYVARCQNSPKEILRWNRVALERADAVHDERVKDFYPSLYLNLGHAYELLGNQDEAKKYFVLAAESGFPYQSDVNLFIT